MTKVMIFAYVQLHDCVLICSQEWW